MDETVGSTLAGKVAVITGGGRDIGRACAMRLAASGVAVAINFHSSANGPRALSLRSHQAAGARLPSRAT